ncbi:MAG TPA: glycosyltransferase [Thermoanaerobaculia bacterium]|jgi:GT2 family glycosyltransferase|nr:glycosyltransferase [Thermoanaerobaculia bacterium]
MPGETSLQSPTAPGGAPNSAPATLSVVIPTHDTRELVLACLAALAAAVPPPDEIILVDDGSGDGTAAAVAASYPAVRLLRHERPLGFTAAANAGAALATGDLLLLLNSDTEPAPEALGALLAAFSDDPRLGVAGAALTYPDGTPQWSGGRAPDARWLFALGSGIAQRLGGFAPWRRRRPVSGHGGGEVEWVTGAALAIRRSLWHELGGFDPRFELYAQDLDLCVRARERGWRVAVVAASRVVHHHGATIGQASRDLAAGEGGKALTARADAPRLWADLVRWAAKRRGPAAGRRAARWLRLGGAVQRGLLACDALRGDAARQRARALRRVLRVAAQAAREAAAAPAAPPAPAAAGLPGEGRT